VARRQVDRRAARGRIAARATTKLTSAQRAFDPLARTKRGAAVGLAILGSLAVHLSIVAVGIVLRSQTPADTVRDQVKIEVRQRPPEPPPEKKTEPPAPMEAPKRLPPKVVKAPPLPPPPDDIPKPVRVVGLSMESTTEGGSGPTFAVGNTRQGQTAERAVSPKEVSMAPSAAVKVGPPGPSVSNRVASHIPVAGVKYELPKRRHPSDPPYPATLKTQGIEGDVTVLVNIDASGKVTSVKIIKDSSYPEFNEAARATALAEEFEPATRDGVAMPYTLSFIYRFRLEDK
jgi:periplasmic protein TonB